MNCSTGSSPLGGVLRGRSWKCKYKSSYYLGEKEGGRGEREGERGRERERGREGERERGGEGERGRRRRGGGEGERKREKDEKEGRSWVRGFFMGEGEKRYNDESSCLKSQRKIFL